MIRCLNSVLKAQSVLRVFNVTRTSQHLCNSQFQNDTKRNFRRFNNSLLSSETSVDRSLSRLDNDIRKTGRINRHEIEEILQEMQDMKKATSNQSLMVIRCCGELVPGEIPANRTKLVENVWKTFEDLNVPMDVSHYNALLRVYLENEHKFDPTEFLQRLNTKGIEPNRVTYQRLIARFCQDGDIDGASTILQHMKEKQLPINEHVFNALILGHAQANDMESAEGILGVMKQAGLEPNDDTFTTLMCGYAKKGDMENVQRIIKDCADKEIFLIDRDFLNVIYALAESGNDQFVDQIIPHIRKHTGYNQDVTNIIFRLVNSGKEDVAFKLLKTMPRGMRMDEVTPSGTFFIKHVIQSKTPIEKLIGYCKELQNEGLNARALARATECALMTKNFDKAFDLLDALHESGMPLKQHFFWPFFAMANSEKVIFDAIKYMKNSGINLTAETLRDYVIPALIAKNQNKDSLEKLLEKLSSYCEIPLVNIAVPAIHHLILTQQLDAAAKFAQRFRSHLNSSFIRKALVEAYIKTKNAESFVQIVGNSGFDESENAREAVGMIVLDLLDAVRSSKYKASILLPVLREFLSHGLGLSNSGAELVQNSLGESLTEEISNIIVQLTSADLVSKVGIREQKQRRGSGMMGSDDIKTAELEEILENSIKAGSPNKTAKKALLFNYCREKQYEKAEILKKELEEDGFVFQVGLQALFLDVYSQQNKVAEAKAVYAEIMKTLDNSIDTVKTLRYAALLLTNGEYQESLEVLKRSQTDARKQPLATGHSAISWKMLNYVAETKNVEQVYELFKTLKDGCYLNINNSILGPLVKVHLVRDDLDAAVNEFERCVNEHRCTPWKQELFCRLIKSDDAERLQKVMDLSTNLHGEVNSLYDLVFAFIQCGKIRQARKILETPGIRARNDKLEYTCQRLKDENRISELENLIEVTKELLDVDRNIMFFYLLQAYCNAGDIEKAESVWTKLQEENVHPSTELLSYLANFLRMNNRPITFVEPEAPTATSSEGSELRDECNEMLRSNDIDKALQLKQRMNMKGQKLPFAEESLLIEKMARAERLGEATRLSLELYERGNYPLVRTMRYLLGKLAAAGDVDALASFEPHLTPEMQWKVMFNSRLCVAYVTARREKEFFENYIKKQVKNLTGNPEIDKANISFPVSAAHLILRASEELLPEFERVADMAMDKGDYRLKNSVWMYHLIKKDFSSARNAWESLKSQDTIMFRSAMIHSRKSKDVELAKELHSQIQSSNHMSSRSKGAAASCVLEVLCLNKNPEEALEYLTKSLESISLQDFSVDSLQGLKNELETKNKSFPYEVPKMQNKNRKDASSSSDSDSD